MVRKTLYDTVKRSIAEAIERGDYSEGDLLPTEAMLCEQHGVSRITVRKALKILENAGLIESIQGYGSFVREKITNNNIYKLGSFAEGTISYDHHSKVINFELNEASEKIRTLLKLDKGEQIYYCKRLRYVDDKPVLLEESWMPVKIFQDLSISILEGSKYHYVENIKGYEIEHCIQKFEPIIPDKELTTYLKLMPNQAILKLISTGYLTDGKPFEHSLLYFNTKGHEFSLIANR
ncbi:UTRA domain-containing protein [Vibrio sp. DW001]|uniref:UTRA domain-containing protein n=1 Tax=Vibrio sp. DW001 TaxID=2912315 RepID=UPI0023AEF290|nr:UTRA domain-containing protein [Vibrio sp. DW001]WED25746.1 UTRA domain-containing protein [Vibrio sp. DW001]